MDSQERKVPCPFCGRPLDVSGIGDGKIGCKRCRNISRYDSLTGMLKPLERNSAAKKLAPARKRFSHVPAIMMAIAFIAILLILWLAAPWKEAALPPPGDPRDAINEVRRHLDSLAK